tara:strand:- start:216 stop:392 length:177 start_codon:yes stop_codon:yes gene_type:complete
MVEACAIDLRAPSSIVQFLPDQFSNNTKYLESGVQAEAGRPKNSFYVFLFGHLFLNTV